MMQSLGGKGRKIVLAGVLLVLLALLAYVVLRSGPLAPVGVTVAEVKKQTVAPALFGIGTVEARAIHKIGPTAPGRLLRVEVQVGDTVKAGELLAEMEPLDLESRQRAQAAAVQRSRANVQSAEAQVQEVAVRKAYAQTQAKRYEQLLAAQSTSEELLALKQQEAQAMSASASAAQANLEAARQELQRLQHEQEALAQQRSNLRLVSPVSGRVIQRSADAGTTVVAGQAVVEIVEEGALWVHARFDQQRAQGLKAGLAAQVALRSLGGAPVAGQVVRVEPRADAVTEEVLAKVEFKTEKLPSIGELAEVTVALPAQQERPVVGSASLQRVGGQLGVWVVEEGGHRFAPVVPGVSDLDGRTQILEGLQGGETVVLYSEKALDSGSRIHVVERLVKPAAGTAK